ncbi:MAG TPA: helix-turn-helix domain-containing protein, partial [Ktedonobacteraceae bacterium]
MSNKELSSELGKLRYRTHDGDGMTQEQVADLINVSTISLRSWESGRFRPSVPNLQKLIEVYVQEGAFSPGKEQEEIRAVWEKAQQAGLKAALDEEWFTELQKKSLSPATKPYNLRAISENAKAPITGANVRIDEPPISKDEPFSQGNNASSRFDELLESFIHLSEKQQDRLRMLDKVHRIWIKGLLEKSLQNDAEIELALCEQPDVVETSWRQYLQTVPHPLEESPSSFRIFDAYENAQGKLLILGEPGSGKTTLLLQLTRILLANARHDISFPIPVIVSLSSWAEKRLPIAKWLVAELSAKYHIPLALSQQWMDQDQLLPLFDGLDEVDSSCYSTCVEELNIYLKEHGLVPTVICSRSSEYLSQPTRLLLQGAVLVQPLTEKQIAIYLSNTRGQHQGINDIFSDNSELQGLARTPLMLRILSTTYGNSSVVTTNTVNGLDIQQQALATYILQMFKRRTPDVRYDLQQTIKYLQWLAQQLRRYNQSAFYIEFMQFDWLPASPWRQLYPALAIALAYGLLSALGFGISYLPYYSFQQVIIFFLSLAAFNTFLYSSFNGIIFGILADDTQTSPDQHHHGGLRQKIIAMLGNRVVYGILNGLLDGIFVGVLVSPVSGWICGLFSCLFCAAMGK